MIYCGFRRAEGACFGFSPQPSGKENWTAPQGAALSPTRARARRPPAASRPGGLGLRVLRPLAQSAASLLSGLQTPAPAPVVGGAAQRPRPVISPAPPLPWAPSAPRCGARLRQPSPRSSHDGGCSPAALSPPARGGAGARGGLGGPAGLALMSPFVSSSLRPFPRARRAPPTSQEGLDDGPDFLSEEDRGVSSTSWFAGPCLPRRGAGVWDAEGSRVARQPCLAGLLSVSSPLRAPPSCSPASPGAARL